MVNSHLDPKCFVSITSGCITLAIFCPVMTFSFQLLEIKNKKIQSLFGDGKKTQNCCKILKLFFFFFKLFFSL